MTREELAAFESGETAFRDGTVFAERFRIKDLGHRHYWIAGYRSAERWAKNPPMPIEDYLRICGEAETAYRAGVPYEHNPYRRHTEAFEVWATVYRDAENAAQGDEWVVLGTPTKVTEVENQDGTFTYTMNAPQQLLNA